jgi:hypothetical protein
LLLQAVSGSGSPEETVKPSRLGVGLGVLLSAGLLAAGTFMVLVNRPSAKLQPYTLRPDDPQVVSFGARIYAQQCAHAMPVRLACTDGLLPAPPTIRAAIRGIRFSVVCDHQIRLAKLIEQPDYCDAYL